MTTFHLLGGLQVMGADREMDLGGPKQRAVLAALLLDVGRAVDTATVISRVWADAAPASAESTLQAYVANLRRALEPGRRPREAPQVLVTRPQGYAVLVDRAELDVTRFEDLAAAGQKRLRDDDPAAAVEALDEALAVWTGTLLPELAGAAWVDDVALRLDRLPRSSPRGPLRGRARPRRRRRTAPSPGGRSRP